MRDKVGESAWGACPWCGESMTMEHFARDVDGETVHLNQANHSCDKGQVQHMEWEKRW